MASSVIRVSLLGDANDLMKAFREGESGAASFGEKMRSSGRNLTRSVTLPILALGGTVVNLARKQVEAETLVESAFNSMGAAAWTTVDDIKGAASELQGLTIFGDEDILKAQSVLLTFGNVIDKEFDRGTVAILDMASALNMDLQSATTMVGKALNDPLAGLSAMGRAGIQFTDDQKEVIASLVETGDTAGAQRIILAELERQFGGTAEAIAQTDFGQTQQAMNQLGDAGEDLGAIILPILADLAGGLKTVGEWFQNLDPKVKEWVVGLAAVAAAVGPVLLITAKLVTAFKVVGSAFKALSLLMMANPWVLLIAAVVALVAIIVLNWDTIVAHLKKAWDWIKTTASAVWDWLKEKVTQIGRAIADFFLNWTLVGRIIKHWDDIKAAAVSVWEFVKAQWDKLIGFFGTVADLVKTALSGVKDALIWPFKTAFNNIASLWNQTLGKVSFTVPNWIPGVGGKGWTFPTMPTLHSGGTYRSPAGQTEGLALLRDREQVLTPEQARMNQGGGGGNINITINALDPKSAADSVVEALQEYERRWGAVPINVRL